MSRELVTVDAERGVLQVADRELDRYEALGLMRDLIDGIRELWPPLEAGWDKDPNREGLSGRIGKRGRDTRPG